MYGENCGIECGNCLNSVQCHHINGTCMSGWDSGFQGLTCTESDYLKYALKCLVFKS